MHAEWPGAARRLLRQSELRRMATERDAKHSSIAELEEVLCVKIC